MRLLLSASPREIPPKNPQLTAPRADGPMRINQPQPRPEHVLALTKRPGDTRN